MGNDMKPLWKVVDEADEAEGAEEEEEAAFRRI